MTTLDAKAGLRSPSIESEKTQATAVEPVAGTTTLITEQQVLFGSAAALAPAKTHRWSNPAHGAVAAVRAMFAKPERPRVQKHYPQRFYYLESALISREIDRL